MGIANDLCDDGETNIQIDFDPNNITHSIYYLCCEPEENYKPNRTVQPIITEYRIPLAYAADHKCMNETIEYDVRLPTL